MATASRRPWSVLAGVAVVAFAGACGSSDEHTPATPGGDGGSRAPVIPNVEPGLGAGFASSGPWISFYGRASEMGDLARVASTFRIINIDADPGAGNFTAEQIATLKAGGKNQVLSYLDVGSCEDFRTYWDEASGFTPCSQNTAAQIGPYGGYPDETWMDPSNEAYQDLIVDYVAPRLVARGVDGFYLDNLELLSHSPSEEDGPCSAKCRQGGLDLVKRLRDEFPDSLIVMQNGTGDATRLGTTGGVAFPRLLDGIAHEEVYAPSYDREAESELSLWQAMLLRSRSGRPFWIAVEDYVGDCANEDDAIAAIDKAAAKGFSSYVSDESAGQRVVCYWGKP